MLTVDTETATKRADALNEAHRYQKSIEFLGVKIFEGLVMLGVLIFVGLFFLGLVI